MGGKKVKINVTVSDEVYKESVSGNSFVPENLVSRITVIDDINESNGNCVYIFKNGDIKTGSVDGYNFGGDGNNESRNDDPENTDPENTDPDLCRIMFDANGGHPNSVQTVKKGEKLELPSQPVKEKESFLAWTYKSYVYDFDSIVTDDMTIVADWNNEAEGNKILVILDSNGGVFPGLTEDTKLGIRYFKEGTIDISASTPVKEGYEFVGWHYIDGKLYSADDLITEDTMLTAYWKDGSGKEFEGTGTYVIFDDSRGSLKVSQIKSDKTVDAPFVEWNGHTFNGWIYEDGSFYDSADTFDQSVVLKAAWDGFRITYPIKYYLNGGTAENPDYYTVDTETFTLNNPERRGYNFEGWTGSNGETPEKTVSVTIGSVGARDYFANWSKKEHNFSIDIPGTVEGWPLTGDVTSFTLIDPAYDEHDPENNDPDKRGYEFDEWIQTGGKKVSFKRNKDNTGFIVDVSGLTDEEIAELKFEAKWKLKNYRITYNLNGGMAEDNPDSYTAKSETFSIKNPKRNGYDFEGWTRVNGEGSEKTELNKNVVIEQGSIGDRIYSAHWSDPVEYNISYNLQNGILNSRRDTYTIASNTFSIGTPVRKGYDFTGWTGTDVASLTKDIKVTKGSYGNREYSANWSDPISYSITYDLDKGSVKAANPVNYTVESNDVTLNNPEKTGYAFKGWSGTGLNGSANKTVVISKGSTGNRQYVANYDVNSYKLTYDANGGTVNPAFRNVVYNTSYGELPVPERNRTGYDVAFLGWFNDKNGGNKVLASTVMGAENTTVYAHWSDTARTDTPYKVIHQQEQLNGSFVTVSTDNLKGVTDSKVTPAVNSYEGFTAPERKEITILPDGSASLTYKYRRNSYNLTVNAGNYIKSVGGSGSYKYGQEVTLTAVPADMIVDDAWTEKDGYRYHTTFNCSFDKWNGAEVLGNKIIMPAADLTVTAIGKRTDTKVPASGSEQYYLTVTKGTNMQSVTGEGWYNKGATATASGTAKATYTDSGTNYTVDSSNSGHRYYTKYTYTVVPVTKTMDSAQTVTVTATESKSNGGGDQYYLTVNKDSGVASVTGAGWYNKGSTANVTATYNTGYKAKSGTGSYIMNSVQTASVTSQKITYNIVYKANGGTGSDVTKTKTHGTAYTILDNQFTKPTGKHFVKWNTKADGTGTNYSAGASYTTEAALTLYAQWAYDTYSVTYNYNNPSGATNNGGSTASQTKTYGTDLTLRSNGFTAPTKTGGKYTFNGWNTKADGSGTAYAAGATYKTNAALTLYAQWKWAYTTYAVTYNYNCPSGWTNKGGLPSNQTKTYGTNLTLSSTKPAVPTKATDTSYTSGGTGYRYKKAYHATFKEWNTKADGTGTAYAVGATYSSNAAVTLYAIWTTSTGKTDDQYCLIVNKDSGVNSVTVKVGSTTISPDTSGDNIYWIGKGGSVTISATAKSGYIIKSGTGSIGVMIAAKTINVTSEPVALKFSSDSNFTLAAPQHGWNGTMQYSTNKGSSWTTWTGSQLNGTASQPIYIRGTGNTKITGDNVNCRWTFTGKHCTGNIETLLSYQAVIDDKHPSMADYCYKNMFRDCTSLITAPELPSTTLSVHCYNTMFGYCTSLTTAPSLPATRLARGCYDSMFTGCRSLTTALSLPATILEQGCYSSMFDGCTKLKIREGGSGTKIFTCPSEIPIGAVGCMFFNTGGTFTGTPTAGKTYYYY